MYGFSTAFFFFFFFFFFGLTGAAASVLAPDWGAASDSGFASAADCALPPADGVASVDGVASAVDGDGVWAAGAVSLVAASCSTVGASTGVSWLAGESAVAASAFSSAVAGFRGAVSAAADSVGACGNAAETTFASVVPSSGFVSAGFVSAGFDLLAFASTGFDSPEFDSAGLSLASLASSLFGSAGWTDLVVSLPSFHIIFRSELLNSSFSAKRSASKSPTPLMTSSTELRPLSTRTKSVARVAKSRSGVEPEKISSASGSRPCWRASEARDCFFGLNGRYRSSSRRLDEARLISDLISSVSLF